MPRSSSDSAAARGGVEDFASLYMRKGKVRDAAHAKEILAEVNAVVAKIRAAAR
jgi:hypothetical protein